MKRTPDLRSRRGVRPLAIGLFLVLAAIGCGEDDGEPPGGSPDAAEPTDATAPNDMTAPHDAAPAPDSGAPEPNTLTVATFNAGLAHGFVPWAAERVPLVAAAVAALDADVVCLQEVWIEDDIDAVLTATAPVFPHAMYEITQVEREASEPACAEREAGPLVACVEASCAEAADLVGCVLAECGDEFSALSAPCLGCVSASVGRPLAEIYEACTTGNTSFAYSGRNGLMILSREPLVSAGHVVLDSSLVLRAVLHARLEDGVEVFCTHLASDLSAIRRYTGPYASFGEEQRAQIEQMQSWAAERAAGPEVWLGDFNTGPAAPAAGVTAELPENWALLLEGLRAPFVDSDAATCTFCADNPLVGAADEASVLIDHVLVRGFEAARRAERIFDEPVHIEAAPTPVPDGRLSDHYGVLVELPRP